MGAGAMPERQKKVPAHKNRETRREIHIPRAAIATSPATQPQRHAAARAHSHAQATPKQHENRNTTTSWHRFGSPPLGSPPPKLTANPPPLLPPQPSLPLPPYPPSQSDLPMSPHRPHPKTPLPSRCVCWGETPPHPSGWSRGAATPRRPRQRAARRRQLTQPPPMTPTTAPRQWCRGGKMGAPGPASAAPASR